MWRALLDLFGEVWADESGHAFVKSAVPLVLIAMTILGATTTPAERGHETFGEVVGFYD